MNKQTKFQASIITALIGFFIGGIINIKLEIMEIFLSAIIGGLIIFFITFYILNIYFKDDNLTLNNKNDKKKGQKVDIIINDTDDLINNYLNK